MQPGGIVIDSPNVKYTEKYIEAKYTYQTTRVLQAGAVTTVKPCDTRLDFRTQRHVPKLGVMLVGWGGNNGTTFTAGFLANKHGVKWNTKTGEHFPNWFGSITQSSTASIGLNESNEPVYVPLSALLPLVHPNDLVVDGWDISSLNLADAMERAKVLDYDLQQNMRKLMKGLVPRPSPYYSDFIAANQSSRADNVLKGSKWEHVQRIQADIRDCKAQNGLDKVVVVWTANTERFAEVVPGVNDTAEALLDAIKADSPLVAPSTIFAVASILEGVSFQKRTYLL